VSSAEGLDRLKVAAFDAAPLATVIFRNEHAGGLVFLEGNKEFDALLRGSPTTDSETALSHMVASTASTPSEPQTVTLQLGDHQGAYRLRARTFSSPGDPGEYLVAQLRTLTDQESTERDLHSTIQQLKDLLDNSTALMYVKDLDGRYVLVNDYFARRFGMNPESIIGLTDHDIFAGPVADVYRENDNMVIRTCDSIEVEEPLAIIGDRADPDEDSRWLSIKFPLISDSGRPYALGAISTDITDRKRAERAARDAMHEAERANRSKSEFLSRMSHELRTPLNAILGFAQLLQDLPLGPRAAESAGHILDAGNHLLSLVNEVLDITWIEAGAPGMATTPVPAIEAIHQALELVRPLAAAQDIEIASDLHGALHRYILADTQRLRQVFLNLLGNAVKFNRPQGAVRVWCELREGSLRFFITDTGPGMSEDDVQRLFTPFVRLAQAADIEGSGLGLALSRKLVEQMGGVLGIEHTAPGEGSTFFVEIRLGPEPEDEVRAPESGIGTVVIPRGAEATILHIEDNYANIRLVENIIAGMGDLNLVSATSGRSGIVLARQISPQLILLDVNLADMSGVDVMKQLKNDERTRRIPVIVLSADATPARIKELQGSGIRDYLTKPFEIHHFARTVRSALALP